MILSGATQYWLNTLHFDQPKAIIPFEYDLNNGSSTAVYAFEFTNEENRLVREFSDDEELRLQIILIVATALLLNRYTGLPLVRLATPVDQPDGNSPAGMLIPLELDFSREKTFRTLLNETRNLLVEGMFHQQYDPAVLNERFAGNDDHPLYDVITVFTNLQGRVEKLLTGSNFIICFTLEQKGVTGRILYNNNHYSEHFVNVISNNLVLYLMAVLREPDLPVEALPGTIPSVASADSTRPFCSTAGSLFIERFEAIVKASPGNMAVVQGERSMTYELINKLSNKLARYLINNVSRPDARVAVYINNSMETVLGILGIIKAGLTFVPIDTALPAARVRYILQDCDPQIVLTCDTLNKNIPAGIKIADLANWSFLDEYEESDPGIKVQPGKTCYIIYTSGTSGVPKGVMVGHASFINYAHWASEHYTNKGQRISSFAFFTSISFDLTITSLFVPLIVGGSVLIYTGRTPSDMLGLILQENKTGVLKVTPSHLRLLIEVLKERKEINAPDSVIHTIIVGGEAFHTALAREISGCLQHARIYNEYGPTEATVGCMIHQYSPEDDKYATVPVGVPINNTGILLLDEKGRGVPEGAAGELYIGGICLSQGYLNNDELSGMKFVFPLNESSEMYYRTGDLAKKLPGGNYIYLGRKDAQVKINGYRIEPEEIENHMRKHPAIDETAVICRKENDNSAIIELYYIAGKPVNSPEIMHFLADFLPAYMMPHAIIEVTEIPLNANGKIDIKRLSDKKTTNLNVDLPVTDTEKKLHAIWKKHLATDHFGINDNFYTLGGDSIKSIGLMNEINKSFGINLLIRDLYMLKTIKNLADHLIQKFEQLPRPSENVAQKAAISDEISKIRQDILDRM